MRAKFNLFSFEIALILIAKIVLLVWLKLMFFNDPLDRHLTGQDLERLFLGQTPSPTNFRFDRKDSIV